MRFAVGFALILWWSMPAQAQLLGGVGHLEPAQDLGCIGTVDVAPDQTAADLTGAALSCLAVKDYGQAIQAFVAMQVFGVYDAQRVADLSAHQAVAALGQQIAAAIPAGEEERFQAAVEAFGTAGQQATCAHMRAIGPPEYHPDYMIQHGQYAFLRPEEPPIVDGFDPALAWDGVLVNFLQCPTNVN